MRKLLLVLAAVAATVPGAASARTPAPADVVGAAHTMRTRHVPRPDAGLNTPCFFTLAAGCTPVPLMYNTPFLQRNGTGATGGPVMTTSTTYLIYWEPSGSVVSANYHSLINRFFDDVGGSSLYGTATEYYKTTGGSVSQCAVAGTTTCQFIQNVSNRAASWIDTGAFPASYSTTGQITDADIRNEVTHAMSVNGWTAGPNKLFLVFLPRNVVQCMNATTCSFSTYCAYHNYFTSGGNAIMYASMPYVDTARDACGFVSADFGLTGTVTGPNGDIAADEEISIASHELMEAVTDPQLSAWYDATGYENGDKCAYTYGPIEPNGTRPVANMHANGHPYLVQLEWQNSILGCGGQS